jgi:uncharacterized protein (TIGR03086 family)
MDAKALFREAIKVADSCISRVESSQLKNVTPCTEWDLKELIRHMVYEMSWVPDLLAGKTVAEVGDRYNGDLLNDDASESWRKAVGAAADAVEHANLATTAHLSYGDFPAEYYIRESGSDMLIHSWDVGQALYCSMIFGNDATQAVYDFVAPRAQEFRASGLFGEQIPTRESDGLQTKLLAFYGRQTPLVEV